MLYKCDDDSIFDQIIATLYGNDAVVNGAVEYVLGLNQNFTRENDTHLVAGTVINLPDELPNRFFGSSGGTFPVFID